MPRRLKATYVDLVATKNGKAVAIESETGKADAEANIRKDLEAEFNRVVCFVPSDNFLDKLKEVFDKDLKDGKLIITKVGVAK